MKKNLLLLCCLMLSLAVQAQADDKDFFRSIGKIYTVFGVIMMIFFGIIVFLFMLERRIAALEKQTES